MRDKPIKGVSIDTELYTAEAAESEERAKAELAAPDPENATAILKSKGRGLRPRKGGPS